MKRILTLMANILVVLLIVTAQVNFTLLFVDYQKVGLIIIILFLTVAIGYFYRELNE